MTRARGQPGTCAYCAQNADALEDEHVFPRAGTRARLRPASRESRFRAARGATAPTAASRSVFSASGQLASTPQTPLPLAPGIASSGRCARVTPGTSEMRA
jgi:hypothetical protein